MLPKQMSDYRAVGKKVFENDIPYMYFYLSGMDIIPYTKNCRPCYWGLEKSAELFIMIKGPSLQNFCPEKAISHWLDGHKIHIGGHTMKADSLMNKAAAKNKTYKTCNFWYFIST